jgi:hypothetical protein
MSKININLKLFFVLIPVIMLVNCNKNTDSGYYNIPYVTINRTINLELPSYSDLLNIGGYIIIGNEGYKGIIVYHGGNDEYFAIERTCTNLPLDECAYVTPDISNTFLKCGHYQGTDWISCCDSKYTMDGNTVLQGPAKYPLKHYQVIKLGNQLQITN